jgi:hypothetical protein
VRCCSCDANTNRYDYVFDVDCDEAGQLKLGFNVGQDAWMVRV